MLVSGNKYRLIEAKVESSEDIYKCGLFRVKQTKIQELSGELITGLSDFISSEPNIILSRKEGTAEGNISWGTVIDIIEQNKKALDKELDTFTVDGFLKSPFLREIIR